MRVSHSFVIREKPPSKRYRIRSRHPPRLIRIFAVRVKKYWLLSYPLSTQQRLWWVHRSFCWFCLDVAHIWPWTFNIRFDLSQRWLFYTGSTRSFDRDRYWPWPLLTMTVTDLDIEIPQCYDGISKDEVADLYISGKVGKFCEFFVCHVVRWERHGNVRVFCTIQRVQISTHFLLK